MSIEERINMLLEEGKAHKHHTYESTGIVFVDLIKIAGTAGSDVNFAYISPDEINVVTENNVHYGYAHFTENGNIKDNRSRSLFEIV